jgi:hypothetical protein
MRIHGNQNMIGRLINFNLTRGDAKRPLEPVEVWAEIGKIFMARATGAAKLCGPARSGKKPVDVRELVKSL